VNTFWQTEVRSIARPSAGDSSVTVVRSPVKAHLADGGTVVFPSGASVGRGQITGSGQAYPLLGGTPVPRGAVPLDSVVGLETFVGKLLAAPTVVVSLAATAVGALATAGLAVAIFGSCPTVYADTGTGPVLEAEGFSYAIAPLLEHRDVDRVRVRPLGDGTIRLELRNEALETHHINHLALTAVRHAAGARVVPDQSGRPVALAAVRPLAEATDRAGRDVRSALADADGRLFATDPRTATAARIGDLDDWIDVAADDLPPGDSVAVVLRLRNSLLNTVLLYEGMLGGRDAADWLAGGLSTSPARSTCRAGTSARWGCARRSTASRPVAMDAARPRASATSARSPSATSPSCSPVRFATRAACASVFASSLTTGASIRRRSPAS
jgi:hypothetical protein